MAPPPKSTERRKRTSSKERESGDELSTLNLWVGDLSPDTVDSDLMAIFGEYGAMDALTSYSPRTYAFVFFKNTEDAKKAKEALQGSVVRGSTIKVEFARPVCFNSLLCDCNLMRIVLPITVNLNIITIIISHLEISL